MELRLLAALNVGGGLSLGASDSWLCCWTAPVVFSDDAARAATLQRLGARRDELAAAVARREEAKSIAERYACSGGGGISNPVWQERSCRVQQSRELNASVTASFGASAGPWMRHSWQCARHTRTWSALFDERVRHDQQRLNGG